MNRPHRGRGVILVFGENLTDSESIRRLLLAANTGLAERDVTALPRPMSLTRDAKPPAVRRWVDDIDRVVRAHRSRRPVDGVVVHRDADGPDPTGQVAVALAEQLRAVDGRPVVPVQMIEAWWFLFPEAVEAVRPGAWRGRIPRSKRDVESITRPKDELRRLTRAHQAPEYAEADSPVIAGHIRRLGLRPRRPCASYERMVAVAQELG